MKEAFKEAIKALADVRGYGSFFNYRLENGDEVHISTADDYVVLFDDNGFHTIM